MGHLRTMLLVSMCYLVNVVLTCSPEGYRVVSMAEMAHTAPIIAYGNVTGTVADPMYPQAYRADFQVKCTYKGGPLPSTIVIDDAGYIPGMCGYKNLTTGLDYIVFLSSNGETYSQMYDDTKLAENSMDELLTYCGLHMEYPANSTTINEICVARSYVNNTDCVRYEAVVAPPIKKPIIPPPPPPHFQGNPGQPQDPHRDPEGSGEDMSQTTSEMTGLMSRLTNSTERTSSMVPETPETDTSVDYVSVVVVVTTDKQGAEEESMGSGSMTSLPVSLSFLVFVCWLLH